MRGFLIILCVLVAGCNATAQAPRAEGAAFGVHVRELPQATLKEIGVDYGVMVTRVRAPADRSGLAPGDVIVGVNQAKFRSLEQFNRLVAAVPAGALQLLVRRADEDVYISLEPKRPPLINKPLRT